MTEDKKKPEESRFVLSTGMGVKIDRSQEEGDPLDLGDLIDDTVGVEDKAARNG